MGATTTDELRVLALGTLFPGFDGTTAPPWLLRLLDEGLAGVVLFERNVPPVDPDVGVAALTAGLRARRADVIVAVDEEGGDVTRFDHARGSDVPGAAALGVVDDTELTIAVAASLGARLRRAGVTLNLAPVADVDADPLNPIIGVRSFGSNPETVARHVAAFVEGQQRQGVAATAKHFPGHGATVEDSHYTVPSVPGPRDLLDRRELVPFRSAVAARTQVVMTAHVRYPALDDLPATLSRRIVTDLLRGELGFSGVVMSDGLDMQAISGTVGHADGAVLALNAGVDALCIGGESAGPEIVEMIVGAITSAVHSGRLPVERLREASTRVSALADWAQRDLPSPPVAHRGAEAARRALHVQGVAALPSRALVLECHDEPTVASGRVPWALGEPLSVRMPGTVVVSLSPTCADVGASLADHPGRPVVLCVRGTRRRPWQRRVVAQVRSVRPDVIVVEHDVPGDREAFGPHHVLTYSGSRVSADVVSDLLAGIAPDTGAYPDRE